MKYNGSLEEVNHAWWATFWSHTYTAWEQIESPAPHGETQVHGLNLDWRRFVSEQTINFCSHEMSAVRGYNPELPITTNMHNIDGIDYREMAKILDVVSWDAYPDWGYTEDNDDARLAAWTAMHHDMFRTFKHKPFLLMESTPSLTNWQTVSKLKRPGMHKLSSLQAVAHGSDSVQYFQWRKSRGSSEKFHGAVLDHSGHGETRVFKDVAEVGQILAGLTDVVGTSTPAQTAILYDWDNRWAIKDAQGIRNSGLKFEETVLQHYRALWEQGIPVDIVGSGDDLSRYKLVIAPMLYLISEENGKNIEQYVEQGGTFLATYWSGVVGETDLCHLGGFPGPLRKTLGIWAEETEGLHSRDLNGLVMESGNALGLSGDYDAHEIAELIHLEGAEALGHYRTDFYAGRPALTVNKLGAGEAYHLATRVKDLAFYVELYAAITAKAGITRTLESDLPVGVTAQLRTDGVNEFVFVQNFSGEAQTVKLDGRGYTDLETGTEAPAELALPVNGLALLKRQAK